MLPLPVFAIAGLSIGLNGAALICAVLGERMPSDNFRFASWILCWMNLAYLLLFARWLMFL